MNLGFFLRERGRCQSSLLTPTFIRKPIRINSQSANSECFLSTVGFRFLLAISIGLGDVLVVKFESANELRVALHVLPVGAQLELALTNLLENRHWVEVLSHAWEREKTHVCLESLLVHTRL